MYVWHASPSSGLVFVCRDLISQTIKEEGKWPGIHYLYMSIEQQSHKILRIRVRLELVGKTHVCLFQIRIMHHVDRKLQWPNPPPPPPPSRQCSCTRLILRAHPLFLYLHRDWQLRPHSKVNIVRKMLNAFCPISSAVKSQLS